MANNTKKKDFKEDTNKVLLVEGVDDFHVVKNLCMAHKLPYIFGTYEYQGKKGVLKQLNSLIKCSEPPQIIGVMLDVDDDEKENDSVSDKEYTLESRWQSVKDKLREHNYDFPVHPNINGTIVEAVEDKPKLGFWFMPNNQDCGMLEDFCAKLAEPLSLAFAQECVEQARSQNLTTFKDSYLSKAVIHTYLAWQKKPGSPLGQSITSQALRSNNDIATKFTNWLNDLFI